jgi:hypothetical protein
MGFAGRIAQRFLHSKLTPLLIIASLAVGALAIVGTPREEEPQISVPMIDVFVQALPGAGPRRWRTSRSAGSSGACGRSRVWSTSTPWPAMVHAMVTVRFKVGENQENSIVKVQAKPGVVHGRTACGGHEPAAGEGALHRRRAHPGADLCIPALRFQRSCARSRCTWKTRSAPCTDVAQTLGDRRNASQFRVRARSRRG